NASKVLVTVRGPIVAENVATRPRAPSHRGEIPGGERPSRKDGSMIPKTKPDSRLRCVIIHASPTMVCGTCGATTSPELDRCAVCHTATPPPSHQPHEPATTAAGLDRELTRS